jgi:hypothetical protein
VIGDARRSEGHLDWHHDTAMMYARTVFTSTWDYRFQARCPHGKDATWVGNPMGQPTCLCDCGGG